MEKKLGDGKKKRRSDKSGGRGLRVGHSFTVDLKTLKGYVPPPFPREHDSRKKQTRSRDR